MDPRNTPSQATTDAARPREPAPAARSVVQAETNLLRFPFFALHTKGLRSVDFREVRGTRVEGGKTHEFVFRVSRNTDHQYPGPLSRKVHFALLSLLRKQDFPFRNPVAFTWRQLAREMGVAYGGATKIDRLKGAILSTQGAMIKSSYALKGGAARTSLPERERGYLLYSDCSFANELLADGTSADRNSVSFADWYLANLNALYAAPLDYGLWNRLNDRSPLASRLYEFLLFNFSAGIDPFTINYPKLCTFLPAAVETYASQARQQLDPAFGLLAGERIVRRVEWGVGRRDELQLQIVRGERLGGGVTAAPASLVSQPDLFESVRTREGTNPLPPTERLVRQFHAQWGGGEGSAASPAELEAARECVQRFGFEQACRLLPKVVKQMRQHFPEAKTFGATKRYFEDVHAEHARRAKVAEKSTRENLLDQAEEEKRRERARRHARLQEVWDALPLAQQEAIRGGILAQSPHVGGPKLAGMLHRLCLDELDRRQGTADAQGSV